MNIYGREIFPQKIMQDFLQNTNGDFMKINKLKKFPDIH